MKLTHIVFADDLFLITAASTYSFLLIRSTIDEFSALSGLTPNVQKSSVYIVGIEGDLEKELCEIVNMPRGYLPVTLLSLPLVSTKLSYRNSQPKRKIQG